MSLPDLFLERLKSIIPFELPDFNGPARKAFRVNTLKSNWKEIEDCLAQHGIGFQQIPWYPCAFTVDYRDSGRILALAAASEGKIYAQGLESMLSVVALDVQPGQAVLDLCAAPGSKTSQIAAHMNNEGTLIANEPVRSRFYRLKAVVDLMGAKAKLVTKDGRYFRSMELFDRVLVDAPCSSEGRFMAQEPESYRFWSLRKIHEMEHKQKGLLLNAGRLIKPGGVLVYSTCTFAPEENEGVVDWFLRKTGTEFELERLGLEGTECYPCLSQWNGKVFDPRVAHCLRVRPTPGMEGFFVAKFIRAAA